MTFFGMQMGDRQIHAAIEIEFLFDNAKWFSSFLASDSGLKDLLTDFGEQIGQVLCLENFFNIRGSLTFVTPRKSSAQSLFFC